MGYIQSEFHHLYWIKKTTYTSRFLQPTMPYNDHSYLCGYCKLEYTQSELALWQQLACYIATQELPRIQ